MSLVNTVATPSRRPGRLMVEVDRHGRSPLIRVSGELDLAGAPLLRAVIEHVSHPDGRTGVGLPVRVQVDLTGVTFADSHGLAPVLDAHASVRAASPAVRRVLQVLRDLTTPVPGLDAVVPRPARPADSRVS